MKRSYVLIGIFLVFIISISVIGSIIVTGDILIDEEKDILSIQSNKEVYFNPYGYTISNPNVIVNPYGNSPLTAIVMFETYDYSEVSITVKSKDGNSDINYTFSKNKYHMIPIYGLYSDYDNLVIIRSEGEENILNIKTDKLPDDFLFDDKSSSSNFEYYNVNYPYMVDSNNEVRWYLDSNYYGGITVLDDSSFIIGSDRYNEESNTVSFYRMNFLGKIYNEYLLPNSYYGISSKYEDNILVLSDKLLYIDIQTGEIINEIINNDNFDYLNVCDGEIILGRDNSYFKIINGSLVEFDYVRFSNTYLFYTNNSEFRIIPSDRFGTLNETEMSSKKISLFSYDKYNLNDIEIYRDVNRITIVNNSDSTIYLILDQFLDKRVYEVSSVKYINTIGLSGKYTVYFKIDDEVYKTDYLLEV